MQDIHWFFLISVITAVGFLGYWFRNGLGFFFEACSNLLLEGAKGIHIYLQARSDLFLAKQRELSKYCWQYRLKLLWFDVRNRLLDTPLRVSREIRLVTWIIFMEGVGIWRGSFPNPFNLNQFLEEGLIFLGGCLVFHALVLAVFVIIFVLADSHEQNSPTWAGILFVDVDGATKSKVLLRTAPPNIVTGGYIGYFLFSHMLFIELVMGIVGMVCLYLVAGVLLSELICRCQDYHQQRRSEILNSKLRAYAVQQRTHAGPNGPAWVLLFQLQD